MSDDFNKPMNLKSTVDISKIDEGYQIVKLNQGAVGHVEHITGTYEGKPFKSVVKTQKKWERPGDYNSWRREYDFYVSGLNEIFTENLRCPKCYHAEISNDETKLWLEYIEGVSGSDLTVEMYEVIAKELGRFHGKLFVEKPALSIGNLADIDGMKNFYHHNRSKKELYNYVRQSDCNIASHLCKMIIEMDEKSDKIWTEIEKLPIVLRHGDFFAPNIFCKDSEIVLIDWDSAGWSYLGEDIVNLIADTDDVTHMAEHYHKCVPAYLKGFSEFSDISQIKSLYIHERIIMHFGYRLIDKVTWRNDIKTPEEQISDLEVLQKIYEF